MLCALILGKELDWPEDVDENFSGRFIERAAHHGVEALIGYQLRVNEVDAGIPDVVAKHFTVVVKRQVAVQLMRSHDLKALLEGLHDGDVKVVLLKGAAIAQIHYPEPWMRPSVDTDLFIAPADIEKTRQVFQKLGYRVVGHTYKSHQFNAVQSGTGGNLVNYDVHWRSSNRARFARVISHEEAWNTGIELNGLGGIRMMSAPLALLQAFMHRAGNPDHDPNRLIWLYDIHLLLRSLDASEMRVFAERAVRENLQEVCVDAIVASNNHFPTKETADVLEMIEVSTEPDTIGKQKFKHSALGLIVDDLRELPSWSLRAALLQEYIAPSSEALRKRYNAYGRFDLPWLYLKYYTRGIIDRVSLK